MKILFTVLVICFSLNRSVAVASELYGDLPCAGAKDSSQAELNTDEIKFLGLINKYRATRNLQSLEVCPCLTAAARWHSDDMGRKNYFSHEDSYGRDPDQRVQKFGVKTFNGENIGAGYDTAEKMFLGWKNSPGHNRNMLSPNHRYIGIAFVRVQESKFEHYWTSDFSR